jgi:hypothetical protein
MARIRSIKPDFWASEQVMDCSTTARLLFIGLWNFCDDDGNHSLNLKTIKAEIFPGDDIELDTVRRLLVELSENSLIVFYTFENKDFLHVTGWHHQKIEKPSYKHPRFEGQIFKDVRRLFDDLSPPGVEGIVVEGIVVEGIEISPTAHESPNLNGHDLLGEIPAKGKPDTVQPVVDAYHRILPKCQRLNVLSDQRRAKILKAVKLGKRLCKEKGLDYGIFWEVYFEECDRDAWLRGDLPNPKNPAWKQNLITLLDEERFAKIMDDAFNRQENAQ